MLEILLNLGIDYTTFLGFLVANLISYFMIDRVIQKFYDHRFNELTQLNLENTLREANQESERWKRRLNLDFGKRIGRIERFFYIYSVMLNQFTLLGAWTILKAFYGWIQKPTVAQSMVPEEDKEITTFYIYIYGNALSILSGLLLGHFMMLPIF